MEISEAWIRAHATARGGWTREQLKAIGVPWPPPKGWLRAVIGTSITDEQRRMFESQSG